MNVTTIKKTATLTAGDIMNPEVIVLREDMTVEEAAQILIDNSISGAPVLNERDVVVGVLSFADIAQHCAERGNLVPTSTGTDLYAQGWEGQLEAEEMSGFQVENATAQIEDVMTPTVYTVPEETPVRDMARTMIAGRVHRLFVTASEKLVGIVTTLDLLRLFAEQED